MANQRLTTAVDLILCANPDRPEIAEMDEVVETTCLQEPVERLEQAILAAPQVDLQTVHVIFGGVCSRTILIPAGVVLTGARTNRDNICIVHGDISVTTDAGTKRLQGFHVISAKAGFKRAGFAHADTYWTTIWKTDCDTVEAAEEEMTDEFEMLQTRRDGIVYERGHEPQLEK